MNDYNRRFNRTLPHPAEHGQYVPGKGYYDRNDRAWRDNQQAIGRNLDEPPTLDAAKHDEFARWGSSGAGFKADPQLEELTRLRDSDRSDDRAKADRLLERNPQMRMTLGRYETDKAKHAETSGPGAA